MDATGYIAKEPSIKGLIKPLDSVLRGHPGMTLGSALSGVSSSHEAVFVFDNQEKFLGLASPYRALYSSYYPYTASVSAIMFSPPNITEDTSIYEAVGHMVSTKVYSLPVADLSGKLLGVINSKSILQHIANNPSLLQSLSDSIKIQQPVTAPVSATVNDIYQLLKERGISRVLLLNDNGNLAGLVTRSGLMHAFIHPTSKKRFPPEGTFSGFHSRAGEKKYREDFPVRTYATGLVDTVPDKSPRKEIILHLVNSPYNSIVLVDHEQKPTGFLSVRDLLLAVSLFDPEEYIPLSIKKPDSAPQFELKAAEEHLIKFGKKLKNRLALEKISVTSKEIKNTKGQTNQYDTTLIVTPTTGEPFVASAKERGFLDSVRTAAGLIEKQRRRSGLSLQNRNYTP